ncbi:cupin domain-containing protein [Rhodococcus rhodochrous]|uniref:Cupin domain-containing protein n=1 Tax=Rhodococcus rhodochrous TaxID=1829 RepID=A0AA46X1C8_RHORH|nr:cupin domain-containing protein [Rhodococcus rhodochrous]UZF47890.1 cupin domain-containing protein [Rhodococcus rhodochrous]
MRGGPLIKHLDDVPWFEAMRLRFDDGHTASIWEKWIEYTPRYVVFYNVWEPGALAPYHGHHGDHTIFVLKGELIDGDGNRYGAGTHMMLDWGDMFDPWEAGPEGAVLYCVIMGTGRFLGGRLRRLAQASGGERSGQRGPPPFSQSTVRGQWNQ